MTERKVTEYIIIHYSATPPSMDVDVTDIDRWHRDRGWNGCGYHYIVKRDGTVQEGRNINDVGAHTKGHNHNSVGVCLVGGVLENDYSKPQLNFTPEQWKALHRVVHVLSSEYPEAQVAGHKEFSPTHCPGFHVREWWANAVGREDEKIDAIAEIYRRLVMYPEGCEVWNVLKDLLNALGEKE